MQICVPCAIKRLSLVVTSSSYAFLASKYEGIISLARPSFLAGHLPWTHKITWFFESLKGNFTKFMHQLVSFIVHKIKYIVGNSVRQIKGKEGIQSLHWMV